MAELKTHYQPGDVTVTKDGSIRIYTKYGYFRLDLDGSGGGWHNRTSPERTLEGEPVVMSTETLCAAIKDVCDNSIWGSSES